MILSNYHTHTEFCDGADTAEDVILTAIERGFTEIGFSAHSPIPGEESWCMTEDGAAEYYNSMLALREKYNGKIKVYIGVEQDIVSTTPTDAYDYVIGSAHELINDGNLLAVDSRLDNIRKAVETFYGGDPYLYVEDYFLHVSEVYIRTRCDIIGHFDLVTKFIEREPLFSTSHPRYVAARDAALERLLMSPALFEINTGAISRGYRTSPYPDREIVERIALAGKPFVISSDAHNKQAIDFGLADVARELDKQGIKYVTSLDEVLSITRA